METRDIDKGILRKVQRKEQEVIRNIGWISISVAFLYMCGYAWRVAYYGKLGIPESFIDFNFPEILIPKPRLLIFIAQFALSFLYLKYHSLYQKEKRTQRAKKMGIDGPLDIIADYGLKININESGTEQRINHEVFCEFLSKYFKEKTKESTDWKFDRKDFENEVLKLFPDIPHDIKHAFVSYELQILCMDNEELRETVADSVGALPQSSELFKKFFLCLFYIIMTIQAIGIVLYGIEAFWTLIFVAVGIGMGYALYKVAEKEDRYQLWQTIWACIIGTVILSTIDGHITAKSSLRRITLPVATISRVDGNEQKGLLLANFGGCPYCR